jgi:hypothetical protein
MVGPIDDAEGNPKRKAKGKKAQPKN